VAGVEIANHLDAEPQRSARHVDQVVLRPQPAADQEVALQPTDLVPQAADIRPVAELVDTGFPLRR
jgi:hypothetical protein